MQAPEFLLIVHHSTNSHVHIYNPRHVCSWRGNTRCTGEVSLEPKDVSGNDLEPGINAVTYVLRGAINGSSGSREIASARVTYNSWINGF